MALGFGGSFVGTGAGPLSGGFRDLRKCEGRDRGAGGLWRLVVWVMGGSLVTGQVVYLLTYLLTYLPQARKQVSRNGMEEYGDAL